MYVKIDVTQINIDKFCKSVFIFKTEMLFICVCVCVNISPILTA